VVYAVLSLTVIRMAPVALALTGSGLGGPAAAFIGWFGPRGLASVIFALLALEDLGERVAGPAVTVIAVTVLLSVIAHGASAGPLARRYGPLRAPAASGNDPAGLPEMPARRLIRPAPKPGTGPAPPGEPG
jgi:NhaP-type Na+/H+ or K+/H+ antiporter